MKTILPSDDHQKTDTVYSSTSFSMTEKVRNSFADQSVADIAVL